MALGHSALRAWTLTKTRRTLCQGDTFNHPGEHLSEVRSLLKKALRFVLEISPRAHGKTQPCLVTRWESRGDPRAPSLLTAVPASSHCIEPVYLLKLRKSHPPKRARHCAVKDRRVAARTREMKQLGRYRSSQIFMNSALECTDLLKPRSIGFSVQYLIAQDSVSTISRQTRCGF